MSKDPLHNGPLGATVRTVEAAVLEAGRYLREAAASGVAPTVNVKADHTLVMNLDLESQRRILEKLPSGYAIVAEEDESSHRLIETGGSYFLVDPLDGTTSCKRFLGQSGGHVGYGPLVGFVKDDVLSVASFYSIPHGKLFTAVKGEGTYVSTPEFSDGASAGVRSRLQPTPCLSLQHAGVLFFVGRFGELQLLQHLRQKNAIENVYRFGGFANDCARLAQGFEQVDIQFTAKPWDFAAALLASEAGLEVWADPINRRVPMDKWRIEANNPVIITHPGIRDELFALVDEL